MCVCLCVWYGFILRSTPYSRSTKINAAFHREINVNLMVLSKSNIIFLILAMLSTKPLLPQTWSTSHYTILP